MFSLTFVKGSNETKVVWIGEFLVDTAASQRLKANPTAIYASICTMSSFVNCFMKLSSVVINSLVSFNFFC
jgi:hypothetical protein